MYRIVTGVTSDVGLPPTYLVDIVSFSSDLKFEAKVWSLNNTRQANLTPLNKASSIYHGHCSFQIRNACKCKWWKPIYRISQVTAFINTLRLRQNGRRRFADDTFERIFLNENVRISIKISLKFVPKVTINNIPALVQIMAWRRPGDKPLSKAMMVCLLTHICVTRPQWVNGETLNQPLHHAIAGCY